MHIHNKLNYQLGILIILSFIIINVSFCQLPCKHLVWEDDFNGSQLNSDYWSYRIGHGYNQSELQYFNDSPNNVSVSNGQLQIIAREENYNGYQYTSGAIETEHKVYWKYGCIEARMRLPEGQGLWPAFWMMPEFDVYGSWPASGEIDIMEFLGHEIDKYHTTCHYGSSVFDHHQTGSSYTLPTGDFVNEYHVFSLDWRPDTLIWKVDGITTFQVTKSDFPAGVNWPFNEEFAVRLNLSVGGSWPGSPDASTMFPAIYEVDYVRAYQYLEDIAIVGDSKILQGESPLSYSVPDVLGATYHWTPPLGAQILSGQGTSEITMMGGVLDDDLQLEITHSCGSVTLSKWIVVDCNEVINGDFENQWSNWTRNASSGANIGILDYTNQYEGLVSGCLEVNQVGANWWDEQLNLVQTPFIGGEAYQLSFYARADVSGKEMNVSVLEDLVYTNHFSQNVILSDSWTFYTYTFSAPSVPNALKLFFSFGYTTGTYCLDDVQVVNQDPMLCPCQPGSTDSDADGVCDTLDACLGGDDSQDTNNNGVADACESYSVRLKGQLCGYIDDSGQMINQLYSNGLLPSNQPFDVGPWNYAGSEYVSSITSDVIDWVLIMLRDNNNNVIDHQAALLKMNGSITDVSGSLDLQFPLAAANESYYISVHSRNHLAIISSNQVFTGQDYDFSSGINQASGTNQQHIISGTVCMYAGDFDANGIINNQDYNLWQQNSAANNQYLSIDGDGSGVVNNLDYNLWSNNPSKIGEPEIRY